MKKAISLVLVLMMLIGMLPVSALAAEGSIAVSNALSFSGPDDQYVCEEPLDGAPLSFETVIQLDPDYSERAGGEPEAQIGDPFIDLTEGEYYIPAVLWAVENGITRGDGAENTFNPEGVCQRCQIVTFLYRFLAE